MKHVVVAPRLGALQPDKRAHWRAASAEGKLHVYKQQKGAVARKARRAGAASGGGAGEPDAAASAAAAAFGWRLSVEDPFEHAASARPHDLGDVLTRYVQNASTNARGVFDRAHMGRHVSLYVPLEFSRLAKLRIFRACDMRSIHVRTNYV